MSRQIPPADLIGMRVANLALWLDARGAGIDMELPACHAKFLATGPLNGGLILPIRNGQLPETGSWRSLYYPSQTWELWLDDLGRYVFVAPQVCPPRRHAVVDTNFTTGEVVGEFAADADGRPVPYPLQNIEIMFFANWLAGCGDLILHAAGVEANGRGYCFAGASGAGKSTLTAAFTEAPGSTVLGEDNLILRYQEDRFWIYGTPWHLNPAHCSPRGAPLEKLFFLDRTAGQGVSPCKPLDGVTRLLQTAFIPYYRPMAVAPILDRLTLLAEQVPFYTLGYQLGSDALQLIQ